jgi:integrase
MRGYLRAMKGRRGYYELVVEGPKDPVTKKRRQIRRGFKGTKPEAEKALRLLAGEVDTGKHRATDGTLGWVLDQWMEQVEGDLAATTVREYKRLVEKRIRPELGERKLSKLETEDLDAFYRKLRKGGLSVGSVRQVHAVIRRALNLAVERKWASVNPALSAKPGRAQRHEILPPSPAEVQRLVAIAEKTNPEFATFVKLAARTGARRGELCALRWSHLDVKRRELLIAHSIAVVDGVTIYKDTKTHGQRRMKLGGTTDLLVDHIKRVKANAKAGNVEMAPDPYMFSGDLDGSGPWNPDWVTAQFREFRGKAKIGHRLHDLRHMHASELGAHKVPIRTISERLGHAQTSTTLNMYSHFLEATDQEAADIIDDIFREPGDVVE